MQNTRHVLTRDLVESLDDEKSIFNFVTELLADQNSLRFQQVLNLTSFRSRFGVNKKDLMANIKEGWWIPRSFLSVSLLEFLEQILAHQLKPKIFFPYLTRTHRKYLESATALRTWSAIIVHNYLFSCLKLSPSVVYAWLFCSPEKFSIWISKGKKTKALVQSETSSARKTDRFAPTFLEAIEKKIQILDNYLDRELAILNPESELSRPSTNN